MRAVFTIALAAGLALAAGRAYAVWTEVQIVPKYLDQYNQVFTISTRDVERLKEVRVSVAPKPNKEISPFTSAELMVIEDNHHVATVPVASSREGAKFTFRFRISPAAAAESRFDIREQGWEEVRSADGSPQRDAEGHPKMEMTLGGQAFWFWLRDFAGPRQGAPAVKETGRRE
jgi:hypothetical protein